MYILSQFRNQPDNQEYITKAIDEIIRKARSCGLNAIIYESISEPEGDLIIEELEHKEFLIQSKKEGISGRKEL